MWTENMNEEENIPVLPPQWEGWKLTDVIGQGSSGKIYRACKDAAQAAVKVISLGNGPNDERVLADCLQEIEILYALREDPHIVRIEDHLIVKDEAAGTCDIFIRMELLQDLQKHFESIPVSTEEVVRIGRDICDALSLCAAHGIVHCDVKAGNIFYGKTGSYKLGDFGMASRQDAAVSGVPDQLLKGTPGFMAPESYLHGIYTQRSDIYALGLVLYRLQNRNRDPFVDPDKKLVHYQEREAALQRRMRGEPLPPPSDAPAWLCTVILKACEFDPQLRYEDAAAFRDELASAFGASQGEEGSTRAGGVERAFRTGIAENKGQGTAGEISLPGTALKRRTHVHRRRNILIACVLAVLFLIPVGMYLRHRIWHQEKTAAGAPAEGEGIISLRENPPLWSANMQEAMEEAGITLNRMGDAAKTGREEFSACFITEDETLINSYYTDMLDLDLYPERIFTPVAESEGVCLVNVLAWSEDKMEAGDSWSMGWNLFLEKTDGVWLLNLEKETIDRFAQLLHEGAYPSGFENVIREGRHNCVMVDRNNYLYLDQGNVYTDMAVMQVRFIWQDAQGNLYVSVLFADGLAEPCTFENLSLRLNDRKIGTILTGTLPGRITVSGGTNEYRTWRFEADAVRTGMQEWEDVTPVLVMDT